MPLGVGYSDSKRGEVYSAGEIRVWMAAFWDGSGMALDVGWQTYTVPVLPVVAVLVPWT